MSSNDEDKDSKTEDPSEKKIMDALEKGNVPFSKEITNVAALIAILLIAFFYVPAFVNELVIMLRSMFANVSEWPLDQAGDVRNIGNIIGYNLMVSLAPVLLPLLLFGLVSSFSQNQPRMVIERIRPKMERVSFMKGLKRLFGWHGTREFIKSLFKFGTAGLIGTIICIVQVDWVLSHIMIDSIWIPTAIHTLAMYATMGLAGTMIAMGVLDLVWTRREWFDGLKMSHQDIKDERKQSEGDPMVKMRNLSLAKDRARRRMINDVENATLVVANPTHFAVAMRYVPEEDRAPVVVAKGQDLIALKIREKAEESGIPVIEDKPLARSLYDTAVIDQEIPVEFYVPIAKIVRILSDQEKRISA